MTKWLLEEGSARDVCVCVWQFQLMWNSVVSHWQIQIQISALRYKDNDDVQINNGDRSKMAKQCRVRTAELWFTTDNQSYTVQQLSEEHMAQAVEMIHHQHYYVDLIFFSGQLR